MSSVNSHSYKTEVRSLPETNQRQLFCSRDSYEIFYILVIIHVPPPPIPPFEEVKNKSTFV